MTNTFYTKINDPMLGGLVKLRWWTYSFSYTKDIGQDKLYHILYKLIFGRSPIAGTLFESIFNLKLSKLELSNIILKKSEIDKLQMLLKSIRLSFGNKRSIFKASNIVANVEKICTAFEDPSWSISIAEAREILWPKSASLTNEQLQTFIDLIWSICSIMIEAAVSNK